MTTRVVLESAARRSFASALDWPGWARSGKGPDEAMDALLAYGHRYARVARRARQPFAPPTAAGELEVVERLAGGGGTEFGVPGVAAAGEEKEVDPNGLKRLVALLRAAWAELDAIADGARGVELRKGPRGGGRDLDKILDHVRDAEAAYVGQLGAKPPASDDMAPIRQAFLDALEARATGRPIENPRRTKNPWSPRYAVRRAIWHVLDHAWEIEDRSR